MCDTLCRLDGRGALFAKNSDRPLGEAQVVEAVPGRPPGGTVRTQYLDIPDPGARATLLSRPVWLWGAEHGVNDRRVAIGNEKVWTVDDPRLAPPALIGMDLVRLVLERATDAGQAVDVLTDLLERHGQGGVADATFDEAYWSSFLVVDPTAGWVVETSGRTWVARPLARAAAISNRLSLGRDWTRSSADVPPGSDFDRWRPPDEPTGHADRRLAAGSAFLAAAGDAPDGAGAAAMVGHLRDHGTGPWGAPRSTAPGPGTGRNPAASGLAAADGGKAASGPGAAVPPPTRVDPDGTGVTVCMHVRGYQATAASMVADLPADPDEPARAWAALGSPCASVYLPVLVPDLVPAALGDPEVWSRFAALARDVEREPSRLGAVHAALAPVEDRLWTECLEAGADRRRWEELVGRSSALVVAALDRLARSGPDPTVGTPR